MFTASTRRTALILRVRAAAADPAAWIALLLTLSCIRLLALQIVSLAGPIVGEHNWRQADTYSVAYNFLHESADFFHPRIDWAEDRSGVMGMEAPLLPYLTFLVMSVFGDDPGVARVVGWLIALAGFGLFASYLRPAPRSGFAVGVMVMVLLSPMGLFELRQIQPDGPMASLLAIAAVCFHGYSRSERRLYFVSGLIAYSCAVLVKSPALAAGPAMWMLCFSARRVPLRSVLLRAIWFALPILLLLAWSAWARYLNREFNAGITYFAIDFDLKNMRHDASDRSQLRHVFTAVLPAYVSSWVLFPSALAGLSLVGERRHRAVALPMLVWLVCGCLFLCGFSSRVESHWYYAAVVFPPVVYFGAIAIARAIDLCRAGHRVRVATRFLGFFVASSLGLAPFVVASKKYLADVPGSAEFPDNLTWTTSPLSLLLLFVLCMLALGLSWRLSTFKAHRWEKYAWFVLFVATGFSGLRRADHDVVELFKWRSRKAEWASARGEELALREVVARYSTRSDRVLVNERNPWFLYLPLRKGWAASERAINKKGLGWYAKRGVRLMLYFPEMGPPPGGLATKPLLAESKRWKIYCLASEGCAEP